MGWLVIIDSVLFCLSLVIARVIMAGDMSEAIARERFSSSRERVILDHYRQLLAPYYTPCEPSFLSAFTYSCM